MHPGNKIAKVVAAASYLTMDSLASLVHQQEFSVQGLGFRVEGLGFRVWGSGFRI